MIKFSILKLIRLYQRTLSLDHGPLSFLYSEGFCRFRPTCSEYTYEAIDVYGVIRGLAMGFLRVLHCHPWSKGGWDPIKVQNAKCKSQN
jgi:putative membrane protein insertion efficiency factor